MTPDLARALAPTGSNRTLTVAGGQSLYATIVEHGVDTPSGSALVLGVHPNLLLVPYADVLSVDGDS